jgi:hypothetical protein
MNGEKLRERNTSQKLPSRASGREPSPNDKVLTGWTERSGIKLRTKNMNDP